MTVLLILVVSVVAVGELMLARRLGGLGPRTDDLGTKLGGLDFRLRRLESFRREHENKHGQEFELIEQTLNGLQSPRSEERSA
jgi:hypothetical protein